MPLFSKIKCYYLKDIKSENLNNIFTYIIYFYLYKL